MIDIKLIRENPQKFIDGAKVKKMSADIDRLLEVDAKLLENKQKLQDIATE
ncbi:MAG: serine--tRNA ligase, partial [Anaerohalosphaeraceae bacterium]